MRGGRCLWLFLFAALCLRLGKGGKLLGTAFSFFDWSSSSDEFCPPSYSTTLKDEFNICGFGFSAGFNPVSILEPIILGGRGATLSVESSRLFDFDLVMLFLRLASFLVSYLPKMDPREAGTINGVGTDPWDSEGAR